MVPLNSGQLLEQHCCHTLTTAARLTPRALGLFNTCETTQPSPASEMKYSRHNQVLV